MALSRRTGARLQANIWPGFVDAMTGLLLVLMFVLTIFMVIQFVLRETITGQETELSSLSGELAALAQALGVQERKNTALTNQLGELEATLSDNATQLAEQQSIIAALTAQRDEQQGRIASFEEQVASLIAQRDGAQQTVAELTAEKDALTSDRDALQTALTSARSEMDAQTEAARLAAAQREAMDALIADLRAKAAERDVQMGGLSAQVEALQQDLTDEEQRRLAESEAAAALRKRLEGAQAELTAMTLALEQQRKKAEDTLTLLAAAREGESELNARLAAALAADNSNELEAQIAALESQLSEAQQSGEAQSGQLTDLRAELAAARAERDAAQVKLAEALAAQSDVELDAQQVRDRLAAALAAKAAAEAQLAEGLSDDERQQALLAQARKELEASDQRASAAQKQSELLNQQVAALRTQLSQLQGLLDNSREKDAEAQVQIQNLGSDLNAALARVAAEERKRRQLEEAERQRLEAQAQDLERYRSEFFGRLREVVGQQEGVRIEGDRFVFSSEVLFPPGGATLSSAGEREIDKISGLIRTIAQDIPPGINWILRVDGHTDDTPLRPGAPFADNWELSQARALSVVRYMVEEEGIPPQRLSANGFGQFQPINTDGTADAKAQNRRIELKLTEK